MLTFDGKVRTPRQQVSSLACYIGKWQHDLKSHRKHVNRCLDHLRKKGRDVGDLRADLKAIDAQILVLRYVSMQIQVVRGRDPWRA